MVLSKLFAIKNSNFTDKILVLSGMKICMILYLFGGNTCIYERVPSIYKCNPDRTTKKIGCPILF